MLAVCGGYQLLGHHYELGDERIPGVGLVDLHTVREDGPRLIGNVAIEVELPGLDGPRVLAGFENHGGRTHLGRRRGSRSAACCAGTATPARSGVEGVRRGTSSGPTCTARCCRRTPGSPTGSSPPRCGLEAPLAPLEDELERAAHEAARRAAGV